MEKIKVYIASPYSNDWMPNAVRRQLRAFKLLSRAGFTPFAPLISHFLEIYQEAQFEREWLDWDIEWLKTCHVLVRIKAYDSDYNEIKSPGSDEEEAMARKSGIPVFVFESMESLEAWANTINKESILEMFYNDMK